MSEGTLDLLPAYLVAWLAVCLICSAATKGLAKARGCSERHYFGKIFGLSLVATPLFPLPMVGFTPVGIDDGDAGEDEE